MPALVRALRRVVALTLLLAVAPFGCRPALPPQADPDRARAALEAALSAWQQGVTPEALAERDPPIYLNDPKFIESVRLLNFTLAEGHRFHGQSVRLTVTLTLRPEGGPVRERSAAYLVDTSPALVIVPD